MLTKFKASTILELTVQQITWLICLFLNL